MRQLIAFFLLFLLACSRPAPAPTADAGGLPVAPTLDAGPSAHPPRPLTESRMAAMRRRAAKPAPHPAPLPDARVVACAGSSTDKTSLMACLDALKTAAPFASDAGAHRLGATRPPVINPAWSVPAWYVNAATGSDANTCVTSGAPCKTWGELVARWETSSPFYTTVVQVHVNADMPITDPITWTPLLGEGGEADLLGTTTAVGSGTLGTVVSKSYVTPSFLSAGLGGSAASYVGLQLVNITHPSVAWVDSVSGSTGTISQPFNASTGAEVDTTATGDSYTIQRPVKVYIANITPTQLGDCVVNCGSTLSNVWVPDSTGTSFGNSQMHFGGFEFDTSRIDANAFITGANVFDSLIQAVQLDASFFEGGIIGSAGLSFAKNGSGIWNDIMLDGSIVMYGGGSDVSFAILGFVGYTAMHGGTIFLADGATLLYYPPGTNTGAMYGTGTVQAGAHGFGYYKATAAQSFIGAITVSLGASPDTASTIDISVTPNQIYSARTLSVAQLDTPIASGGLGEIAMGLNMASGFMANPLGFSPTIGPPYITPIGNGGTGLDAGCPAGEYLGGSPFTCGTPGGTGCATCTTLTAGTAIGVSGGPAYTVSNTGVTSAVAGTGIGVSAATGAVTFSNSGVTSLAAGTGISVSGSTGAVTVANTVALPTLTNNDILVGQGTTTPAFLAPGPLNSGVISTGTVWQAQSIPTSILAGTGISISGSTGAVTVTNSSPAPSLPLSVANGGTGNTAFSSGSIVQSAGSTLNALSCSVSGTFLGCSSGAWGAVASPAATLIANSGVSITTAATFFTAATFTDSAPSTQNYLCTGTVRIAGPDLDQFTFGLAVNSTTVATLRSGVVVSAGTYAGGIVDIASGTVIARTAVSGTNTFNLLVKSLNTTTGFCNADLSCVRTN